MEEDVRGMVKASSWQTYQNQMNRHILPRLGGLRLSTVTPAVVYEFVEELHEKELADSTIHSIYRLLSAGLRGAVDAGLLRRNPCKKIRIHRTSAREQRVLSREEQRHVEEALERDGMPEGLLALYTGLRLGEVCALKWMDIDWERGMVTVRRTVQRLRQAGKEGRTRLTISTPKSPASCRAVPAPEFLLERLREMRPQARSEFVFGTEAGAAGRRSLSYPAAQLCHKAAGTGCRRQNGQPPAWAQLGKGDAGVLRAQPHGTPPPGNQPSQRHWLKPSKAVAHPFSVLPYTSFLSAVN